MGALKLITNGKGEVALEDEFYQIIDLNDVLIRVKYSLLTPLDLEIIKGHVKPKFKPPYVLSNVALGIIVDAGVNVDRSIIGRIVMVGPYCGERLFGYMIQGLAKSYVATPKECITFIPKDLLKPEMLIVPCICKLLNTIERLHGTIVLSVEKQLFQMICKNLNSEGYNYKISEDTKKIILKKDESREEFKISLGYTVINDVFHNKSMEISCQSRLKSLEKASKIINHIDREDILVINIEEFNLKMLEEKLVALIL